MFLTKTQRKAVNELVNIYKNEIDDKKIVEFKAPTGSGKTFMISNVIEQISTINKINNKKTVFIIVTLSSSDLPKQMENNMNEYRLWLPNLPEVERIESPSTKKIKGDTDYTIKIVNNQIYIFGASSFGKNRVLTDQGKLRGFINELKEQNYQIIYIRDEAHYGGEKLKQRNKFLDYGDDIALLKDEQRYEYLLQTNANYIIKMTATPKGKYDQVVIDEFDLQSDSIQLLKNQREYNNWNTEDNVAKNIDEIDNEELIKIACKKFKEIKKAYADNEKEPSLIGINPAMLIQVDNDSKTNYQKNQIFQEKIKTLTKIIGESGLTYYKYFDENDWETNFERGKRSLQDISRKDSEIDVIIFKIGPATGWNIPRACMLLQLRDVSSQTLNTQTLGRIKRNPNPNFTEDDNDSSSIRFKYFVYSNIKENDRQRVNLRLREEFKNEELSKGEINSEIINMTKNTVSQKNKKEFFDLIVASINKKQLEKEINEYYKKLKNDGYLIAESRFFKDNKNVEKEIVERKIENSIELELYILDEFSKHNNYLDKGVLKSVYDLIFTNEIENNVNFQNTLQFYIFCYTIIKNHLDEIRSSWTQLISKIERESKNQLYILTKNKRLPLSQDVWKDKDKILEINEEEFKYAYFNPIEKDKNNHYFDSETEVSFIRELMKKIESNKLNINNNFKLWSRNPVFHGLSFKYFNEENEIKKSYPDFVLLYNQHEIHIEVKSVKDYNSQKTEKIINGYKKYIDSDKLIQNKLTLSVCKYDKDKKKMSFYGASTNNELNSILSEQNNTLDIDELFKIIEKE
ncbi:DEAD/DEAH box helicase family protein [Mycoplasmopsis lipofaciens]|uniref:DEAD/DEAH box helicase family protein n=1 Tax=Mycoplasmopsis lipofaciens TaxID=114884 RepID=UPI00068E5984|nr:DEAD/DEAH box helicase family protein [Mycoplasmopsis lipofaciens]